MWLFHPLGFASIVEDLEAPGNLLVRGRVAGDLERLFPGHGRPQVTPDRDYRYRMSLPRELVAERLAELALDEIDYPNFKDACPDDRHLPYLRVWTAMHELQQERIAGAPRSGGKRRKRKGRPSELDLYDDLYRYPSAVRDCI